MPMTAHACMHASYVRARVCTWQEEGVEDDPSSKARRVYHMGNLLQKKGEVKEAAKMYRSAVKLDPAHKASHYNLGASFVARFGHIWLCAICI